MAHMWLDAVRNKGILTIVPSGAVSGSSWGSVLREAVRLFNSMSAQHWCGVKFELGTDPATALVSFDSAISKISYQVGGSNASEAFDGNGVHGSTKVVLQVLGSNAPRIERAFIFVPATPKGGGKGGREVGDPVKLVIAIHELVHAAGLQNSDHSPFNDPDFFAGVHNLHLGSQPQDDRVELMNQSSTRIPPLWMNSETGRRIAALWPPHIF